ncbi:MAG: hypothetical protein JWR20_2359, partial [Marmoricola sp.]|nr:hypothetical protein [Marmoricola sp.]
MDEQDRRPDEHDDTAPLGSTAGPEHTRPIPSYPYAQAGQPGPYQGGPGNQAGPNQAGPNQAGPAGQGPFGFGTTPWQPAYPPVKEQRSGGRRGLTAGVLVGALLLGGAAGVGGAAAYSAIHDDQGSSVSGSSGSFTSTGTPAVKDGTVEKVSRAVLPSVVKVNVTGSTGSGSGSGIILTQDGEILTNNHVVDGVGSNGAITVNFNDGTTRKATVVGTDPVTDVAVIKVAGVSGLTPARLGRSGDLSVGQTVVAVGSPYGLDATVTSGIVSALNRPVSVATTEQQPSNPFGQQGQGTQDLGTTYPAIQTDAAINPGNSGGALTDLAGNVVGINASIRTAGTSSTEESGSIGLGFAIPIDEVLPIVDQMVKGETPTHARLGISVSNVAAKAGSG